MKEQSQHITLFDEGIEDALHSHEEELSFYPIEDEEENSLASVSIGHIDFRASFYFRSNEIALKVYELLKQVVDMDID